MRKFNNYQDAEQHLIREIVESPDFITQATYEKLQTGFILTNPRLNENSRSNYNYAADFFEWMITGEKELPQQMIDHNPWIKRFVDSSELPENFSTSYGWKIMKQLDVIMHELKTKSESRRGYINILTIEDQLILDKKTTMEFPCTIGIHFMVRQQKLHLIVNMRSNNIWSVMPYDVYNFTRLQRYVADKLGLYFGDYYHQINSAHMFKGDVRRWQENKF